ncbi:TPA: hypothetical protein ACH3X1_010858 [Trebouxia sp. C0004]
MYTECIHCECEQPRISVLGNICWNYTVRQHALVASGIIQVLELHVLALSAPMPGQTGARTPFWICELEDIQMAQNHVSEKPHSTVPVPLVELGGATCNRMKMQSSSPAASVFGALSHLELTHIFSLPQRKPWLHIAGEVQFGDMLKSSWELMGKLWLISSRLKQPLQEAQQGCEPRWLKLQLEHQDWLDELKNKGRPVQEWAGQMEPPKRQIINEAPPEAKGPHYVRRKYPCPERLALIHVYLRAAWLP